MHESSITALICSAKNFLLLLVLAGNCLSERLGIIILEFR